MAQQLTFPFAEPPDNEPTSTDVRETDYVILSAPSTAELATQVVEYLRNDYELHGSFVIDRITVHSASYYYQAMY